VRDCPRTLTLRIPTDLGLADPGYPARKRNDRGEVVRVTVLLNSPRLALVFLGVVG
jgi:hypothetical protein